MAALCGGWLFFRDRAYRIAEESCSETLDEGIGAYAEQGAAQPAPAAVILRNVTRDFDIEHGAGGSLKHKALGRSAGRREHFRALDDVSLESRVVPPSRWWATTDPGKSTMLKLIAKIFPPTCGEIDVHGRVTALLELGAGFHPELTGRENVYLSGSISGRTRAQVDGDIEAVKDFSGLGDFFESPVKVYSSGMFVRLGFAVAVHLDPEILIVDEVVAVGDEQFQRQCFDHLRKLRRRGVTIIFVSHAIGLVEQLADRAAWLDHGVIKQVGTATEIAKSYIAAVNRAELDAQPAPVHDDASPAGEEGRLRYQGRDNAEREGRRRGTGEASVTGVEFFGADGVTPTEIVKARRNR
ncbi:MAG: ABC transporter ATP-binding protein [Dermatophilaceae bacterium]